MTTHENVNRRYADLQAILRDVFQAEGRGLVEMTISIQDQLPRKLVWELRSIGHIRNQVVHENLAEVPKYFEPLCKEAQATLKQLRNQAKLRGKKRRATPAAAPSAAATHSATPAPATKPPAGTSRRKAQGEASKTLKPPKALKPKPLKRPIKKKAPKRSPAK
jgi:hypothetical protein